MKLLKSIILLFTILIMNIFSAQQKEICRYTKTPTGYLMVLRQGDDVIAHIENLAKTENIPSASFTGIGFASDVTFGFYDFNAKKFNPKTFNKVEMGSLTGSIAWNEKGPSIHVHGVATDDQFNAFGGHILSLHVGTGSMEIYITLHDKKLERKVEQPLNANVLQIKCQ
ncbi:MULTISPECIES: PPC domain-containing DNA-binding protein [Chryseobacterium]|jgi:predicted DNA-binding protein with PD1-like motif|uniref:DNA-binding protein with PD1-like motif n=1 Tax=Chryseobacterium geocarposphaerae TaxID=1416776 RepID=A0ABU1LGW3_9FLAO|nr:MULTISPECIES: PPC domain-containing DNA-binding protein [Chryseobacterium]ALR29387.1 DNA-binding protein [Chryseobacterium sp. IHB B 17019]MDR6405959.1 putative DNA-binding protein with PD1-like motif [Chryseobacterium geocarposphaerae]